MRKIVLIIAGGAALTALAWAGLLFAGQEQPRRGRERKTDDKVKALLSESLPADDLLDEPLLDDQAMPPRPPGRGGDKKSGRPFEDRPGPGPRERERGAGPRGPFRGPGPEGEDGRHKEFMSAEEAEDMMALLKEHYPERHEQMQRLRERDPQAFRHMLARLSPPLLQIMRIKREDPEMAEVLIAEHQTGMNLLRLSREYRESSSETARKELLDEIRLELDKRFIQKQKRLELEIEKLRKRLEQQAQRLEERKKNKDQIIAAEVLQLKGLLEDEGF